jgi:hypothetical protein
MLTLFSGVRPYSKAYDIPSSLIPNKNIFTPEWLYLCSLAEDGRVLQRNKRACEGEAETEWEIIWYDLGSNQRPT